MTNLALHNTTLAELQQFFQKTETPVSERFTVIFDHLDEESIHEELPVAHGTDIRQSFVDFTQLPAFGMWSDGGDLSDYLHRLRKKQWNRHHD